MSKNRTRSLKTYKLSNIYNQKWNEKKDTKDWKENNVKVNKRKKTKKS